MGKIRLGLVLTMLLCFSLISIAQVTIAVVDPADKIFTSVSNCKFSGAATDFSEYGIASDLTLKLNINNPRNSPYDITYETYDFPTQSFVLPSTSTVSCMGQTISWPGKITVSPGVFTTCSLTIPVILGGTGNGTITQELIRIHIAEQSNPSNTQTLPFTFQINHFELASESTLQTRKTDILKLTKATNDSLVNSCYKGYCCGLLDVKENLGQAAKFFSQGDNDLGTCKLTSSFSDLSKSLSYANNASSLSKNQACEAALTSLKDLDFQINKAEGTIENSKNCSVNESTALLKNAKSRLDVIKTKLSGDSYSDAQNEIKGSTGFVTRSVSSINCSEKATGAIIPPLLPPSGNPERQEPSKLCPLLFILLSTILAFCISKKIS